MAQSTTTTILNDYLDIKPIAGPIRPRKQAARRHYGSHPYFTKRAWNVVQEYIKRFSKEGDTVLDPFGGSGVTAVEALVLRRKAIHLDISPLANFLCEQTAIAPVNLADLGEAFTHIQGMCEKAIQRLYTLTPAELAAEPIPYWYPQGIRLPKNADVEFVEELFTRRELIALSMLWHAINEIEESVLRDLMRFCFSATLAKVNQTFISAEGRAASRGGSTVLSLYRYAVPKNPVELNVWDQFKMRFGNLVKAKKETNKEIGAFYSPENFHIIQGSATELYRYMKAESVDYIYTDPPYGRHIAYLDLSTMWLAWLGMDVTARDRQLEAIEGGDLDKTKEQYANLLSQSIQQMFYVLKFDRWLSIVFAHKDPAYWDTIVKACQHAGFEYVNTAVQPVDVIWSVHKKKSPLTVLSGELVLNFRKVRNPRTIAITHIGRDVTQLIKDSAEQTIVRVDGATTEDIYHDLIPLLLEHGLLGEVREKLNDITPLLQQDFNFSEADHLWHVKPNTKLGSFIPIEERIRFYLLDLLKRADRENRLLNIDDIVYEVMPKLINGITPPKQTILNVLQKVAYSPDGEHYSFTPASTQLGLQFPDTTPAPTLLPTLPLPDKSDEVEHDSLIYRLAMMGKAAGYFVWIGKKEQTANFNGQAFADISLASLPFTSMTDEQKAKVSQVDVIWFDKFGTPTYAFEVEKSTTITSALERFARLLELSHGVAGKLVIVAPKSRQRKLNQVLRQSTYIGHPLYMETKVSYVFNQELLNLYDKLKKAKQSDVVPRLGTILHPAMH